MRSSWRVLLALGVLQACAVAEAQIYTCTAPDGTRIFSDEKCGPDAKVVPGISTSRRPASRPSSPRPAVERKSAEELDALLEKCNAGDMNACTTWTRAGGPNRLKDKERATEKACEAGSLADCETRYCHGRVNQECRARVLQAAKVAGADWYLRDTGKPLPDGSTRYEVRCIPEGAPAVRDVVVTCTGKAGPDRCQSDGAPAAHARLDLAAGAICTAR